MTRPSARNALLEAAEMVVMRDGAARLTLDAVAEAAGMSKGGVLYHFPNKSALLEAMLDRLLAGYEERFSEALSCVQTQDSPAAAFTADVHAGLDSPPDDPRREVGAALLAVLANEPALIARGREFHKRRYERSCGTGLANMARATVLLAVDGLKLLELLRVSPFSARERERICAHIRAAGEQAAHES